MRVSTRGCLLLLALGVPFWLHMLPHLPLGCVCFRLPVAAANILGANAHPAVALFPALHRRCHPGRPPIQPAVEPGRHHGGPPSAGRAAAVAGAADRPDQPKGDLALLHVHVGPVLCRISAAPSVPLTMPQWWLPRHSADALTPGDAPWPHPCVLTCSCTSLPRYPVLLLLPHAPRCGTAPSFVLPPLAAFRSCLACAAAACAHVPRSKLLLCSCTSCSSRFTAHLIPDQISTFTRSLHIPRLIAQLQTVVWQKGGKVAPCTVHGERWAASLSCVCRCCSCAWSVLPWMAGRLPLAVDKPGQRLPGNGGWHLQRAE